MKIFRYSDFIKESSELSKAIIITGEGFQDAELFEPKSALEEVGYSVIVAGVEVGEVKAYNSNKTVDIEILVSELNVNDYDILILPGGKAPDEIRKDNSVISFVKDFYKTGRRIGAICHGPQILVTADIVDGVEMTCYPDMKDELIEAGANYVDKELVVDGQFITSRNPDDLPVFCKEIVK